MIDKVEMKSNGRNSKVHWQIGINPTKILVCTDSAPRLSFLPPRNAGRGSVNVTKICSDPVAVKQVDRGVRWSMEWNVYSRAV